MSSVHPLEAGSVLREHRQRIKKLEADAAGGIDGPWIVVGSLGAPPFENGWVDGGDNQGPLSFRKMADKTIRFRGSAKTGASGTTVFTLPAGYRPIYEEPFVTDLEPIGFAKVRAFPSGAVKVMDRIVTL